MSPGLDFSTNRCTWETWDTTTLPHVIVIIKREVKHSTSKISHGTRPQCSRGTCSTLSLPSSKRIFSAQLNFYEICILREVVIIGSIIIFHLSKPWKAMFFHRMWWNISGEAEGKFEIDHLWMKGLTTHLRWLGSCKGKRLMMCNQSLGRDKINRFLGTCLPSPGLGLGFRLGLGYG